ncbi:MAG: GHKL domain-containing protein [Spirochaetales bacterium]|nr:GHKL domain-containing protein [Spirochaetales bacterium]
MTEFINDCSRFLIILLAIQQKFATIDPIVKHTATDIKSDIQKRILLEKFRVLSNKVTKYVNGGFSRVEFLKKIIRLFIDLCSCEEIELRLIHSDKEEKYEIVRSTGRSFSIENKAVVSVIDENNSNDSHGLLNMENLCINIMKGKFDPALPLFTTKGSFFINNTEDDYLFKYRIKNQIYNYKLALHNNVKSLIIIPLINGDERVGLLKLFNPKTSYCTRQIIDLFEQLTQTLSISLLNQRTQAALRERVKELTCMYGIAQAAGAGISIDEIMQSAVELLPPAWQYPKITCGKIVLDGQVYATSGFRESPIKLHADLIVRGENRGSIEVIYLEETVEIDEGPFLKEERKLIDNIAKALALIIEQKQAEQDKKRLKEQIRHADRLATIGQLAAGVAHELNEPLSNILGFAQLITKSKDLSIQIKADIEKIVNASLHAREIVKKLLIFSRQMPTKMIQSDLNQIIEDGLFFLESRCSKEGVAVIRLLDHDLPKLTVDPAQITQVLVNLVVNAIQAMADGGTLKVETCKRKNNVLLIVEDTGEGMTEHTLKQIFLPFFTTKEVGQGTGLGLAVVHGIVTSHGGSIEIDSSPGKGTRFQVTLPIDQSCVEGDV